MDDEQFFAALWTRSMQDAIDWQEAAEFEARVAVKLATDENCGVDEDCPPNMPYGWGRLKAARLAVAEEMDGTD